MTTETLKSVSEANFVSDVIDKSKEKIIIVDFWAPWCGPCKALTPILERQAIKKKEQLEVVKVNIDENQAIASQLRIQSIPAVFAFSDGQPVDGFMGAKSEPEVEKFFETLVKKFSKKVVDETDEINNLLIEERFEDAKIVLEELISTNPSPEKFSLLIKSLIGLKSFDEIEKIIKSLSSDIIKDSKVQAAISSYELLKNSSVESSKSEILDEINRNPSDLDAKMNYSKILLLENNFSECIDVLLEIFKEDREWREGLAKKQLLSIFEHLGSDDALSKKGRRSLTSLIFV
tara:strand:+ start:434 stop:1303 length:870 start_codon:yes stop_codon:yes gene_type:complete